MTSWTVASKTSAAFPNGPGVITSTDTTLPFTLPNNIYFEYGSGSTKQTAFTSQFKVRLGNLYGWGSWGDAVSVPLSAPGQSTGIVVSLVGSNYGGFGIFQVSWTNPCNTQSDSGLINGTCNGLFISDLNTLYIYYSGTSTTIPSTSRTVNLSPPLSTYVLPSIPVTISTVSVYISTSNNKGFGPNSDYATCNLTTPAAPPYFILGDTFWSAKSTIPGFCTNGGVVAYFTFTAVHPCYGQFCNGTGFVLRPSNYVVRWTTGGNTFTYYNASSAPTANYNGSVWTNFTGVGRVFGPAFTGTTVQSLACIGDTGNVATNTVSVAIAAYTTIGLPFTALSFFKTLQ